MSSINSLEWKTIKIPFILFTSSLMVFILFNVTFISGTKGICSLFDCNIFVGNILKIILLILIVIFSIMYCLEIKMVFTTFFLCLLSYLVFSIHESFGVSLRTGILPLIFGAQSLAYFFNRKNKDFDIKQNRIFYSIQVIVSCYTLSAISKILTSGTSWLTDTKYLVVQNLKNNQMDYLDGFYYQSPEILDFKSNFIISHQGLIGVILSLALVIELFSFVTLISKKHRMIWGILLLLMHVCIFVLMEVAIFPFIIPMLLFILNPLYLLTKKLSIFQPKTI